TVNTAEFLLTASISTAFIATIGLSAFTLATVGLIIGGVVAAPFGALFAKRIKARTLLVAVSIVLIATSLFSVWKAWPIF
ncbi:MAG TPA: sulfite exporter TauE/SafE family protein, partial [Novosphingobium sp.]|nr:sulfite exporter TauE/SafE family protein [Novosphingobium sp.]